MQLFNKNIKIHRGETFSLQFSIRTENGAPYIISDEIANPYVLLSISDSLHAERGRYVKNYWLSLKNVLRFELTRPLNIKDIKNNSGLTSGPKYDSMRAIAAAFIADGQISGYVNHTNVVIKPQYCVFYSKDDGYCYYDTTK